MGEAGETGRARASAVPIRVLGPGHAPERQLAEKTWQLRPMGAYVKIERIAAGLKALP